MHVNLNLTDRDIILYFCNKMSRQATLFGFACSFLFLIMMQFYEG